MAIAISVDTFFIFPDSLAQRITMNSQFIRRFGKIVMMAINNFLNKLLFKFLDGFIKENSAGNHLVNQGFQFSFHGIFLDNQRHVAAKKINKRRLAGIQLCPAAASLRVVWGDKYDTKGTSYLNEQRFNSINQFYQSFGNYLPQTSYLFTAKGRSCPVINLYASRYLPLVPDTT